MSGDPHSMHAPVSLGDLSANDRRRVEKLSEPVRAKVLQTIAEIMARGADNRDPVGQAILQVRADETEERQETRLTPK
jgi:hypothetical protein